MTKQHLFVYGTLLRKSDHELADKLRQNAGLIGEAVYCGCLFMVDYYPGAVPSDNPDDQVFGEVYELTGSCPLLPELDIYEECAPGFPEPTEYIRKLQTVTMTTGKKRSVWIYLYNHPTATLPRIASGRFEYP